MKFVAKSLSCVVAMFVCSVTFAAEDIDIELKFKRGQQHRVQMQFEHEGKVIMQKDPEREEEEFRMLPMKTIAKLGYFQRFTGKGDDVQAIRFYDEAKGTYEILKGQTGASLYDDNRLVVVRVKSKSDKRIQMASVAETLTQHELELLRNPVDPLSVASLVNHQGAKVGDYWKPSDNGLANFCAVDRIIRNDVKVRLKEIKNKEAILHVTGKLRGGVDDVSTDMEIAAIVKIKLGSNQELARVKMNLREIRQPGQIAPGYDGKSSISLDLVPDDSCEHLTNEALVAHTKGRVIEQRLQWQSPGLKLKYDPRWRVIASEREAAILRFVSGGSLLAQCNIVQLPARPANKPLTLEEYKKEVARIIAADEVATIVDATEFKTDSLVRGLSVEVEGSEGGVPVSWIYYHLNDKDGRRLTFVFTLEREVINQFLPADRKLVGGLVFGARPVNRKLGTASDRKAESSTASRR
ncbi:hypothetical protein [Mariniblastus fucicola]|uniref:SLA1 homology domain-containing protein n=1 Tax=Mariniblastus fucicola TaxID=980251 RepID=A0A5B9PFN3_9BACT|nr:hypothetical protein [Mariniblastus fucicola]QEG24005.1 hypothetical protein MFFC18_39110 [Mariniblastus fucicola]